jgi:hypothetical protein
MLFTTKIERERVFLRRGITTMPYIYSSIEGSRINLSWELVIGGAAAIQAAPARYTESIVREDTMVT